MRFFLLTLSLLGTANLVHGEDASSVQLATHNQSKAPEVEVDQQAVDRIRKIVLNQGEDARALANLVQLARNLPPQATTRLYDDLATDYLQRGKYNQAASVLQQLLNQYPQEPLAESALRKLVRLYCSGEVAHSQTPSSERSGSQSAQRRASFSKYAQHIAGTTVLANPKLSNDAALIFQRAVAMRNEGQLKASLGALTKVKRNRQMEPWRTRALAEHWLHSDRKDDPPMQILACVRTDEHPHLDGTLDDPCWQADRTLQFAYNDGFLYMGIAKPKQESHDYTPGVGARTYDADLSAHDRMRLLLDVDRDYATCYELVVDHRGWTNDRCWHETDWNPKWYVAAGGNETHWTIEAAIPMEVLTALPPQAGAAWAVAGERVLPGIKATQKDTTEPRTADSNFSLLLFQ